jgi:small subunit ribosomal protein S2
VPALVETPAQVSVADDVGGGNQRKERTKHMTTTEIESTSLPPGAPDIVQPAAGDAPITIREMMEAGVHFGHQTKRWNPKMKTFIFGARNGIHIIDLQQTVRAFKRAYNFLVSSVAGGRSVLFVGTKKQAQEVMRDEATRSGQYYVTNRWLGGTLTNFHTVKGSIDRLHAIEKMSTDGTFERMTKKEVLGITREREKLEKALGGIKTMTELPGAVFIVDVVKEHIAVTEARKLEIPIVAIVDTNCDPDVIDYPIPGNDDAIRSLKLFAGKIGDACILGQKVGRERANQQRSQRGDGGEEQQTIRVSSGGEGPRVEVVSRRRTDLPTPEAAATPEDPERS